jgi:cytochrome c oxidase cbb3-type subunit III
MPRHLLVTISALALTTIVALTARVAPVAAQHSYTPQQLEEGRRLYETNCGRCHSNDGAGVTGVELFKQIRRANTDDDVAKLIQEGIPGTSMPSHTFTTPQALAVVGYMRSMVGVTPTGTRSAATAGRSTGLSGDAVRGKTVYDGKGACTTCHALNGVGSKSGPDLAVVTGGAGGFAPPPPTQASIEMSILEPDADVAVPYRVFQLVTKQGQTIRGTLLNQDTFTIQLRDQAGELRAFQKADLASSGFLPSPMPSYATRLTPQEVADVAAYLLSVRGQRR